jgi:dihydropteroate synthase
MSKARDYLIMGIVNVTPDSFSDGNLFLDPKKASEQCFYLADDGADYIDLGAESSRPGASVITPELEWQRLEPVLDLLARRQLGAKISVDTTNSSTMLKATAAGAVMINNISGLADPETLVKLAAAGKTEYIAMHMAGTPDTMQKAPLRASDATKEVESFFATAKQELLEAGFVPEQIWLDPGIGFGKTDAANLNLMAETVPWSRKYNIALGISRKSWLGRTLDIACPTDRDKASKTMEFGLWIAGAKLIRTHDVKGLSVFRTLLNGGD